MFKFYEVCFWEPRKMVISSITGGLKSQKGEIRRRFQDENLKLLEVLAGNKSQVRQK